MESSSKFAEWAHTFSEWLHGQEWYQQLRGKWEELEPQNRRYVLFGLIGLGCLAVFFFFISAIWSVYDMKAELSQKQALLSELQAANDEVRRLKDSIPNANSRLANDGGAWTPYLEAQATSAGIERSGFSVSAEKPGTSSDQVKEALFEISLKRVSIRQAIRYAIALENGSRPIKLKNLIIDTKSDLSGYMDVTLAISAFSVVEPQ